MIDKWKNAVVSSVVIAMYVAPGSGQIVHSNRAHHGFVLNDKNSVKDYIFSDGTVLHTEAECLFYLPKHSSYQVKVIKQGGCYAVNFDTAEPISDAPFGMRFRNTDALFKLFKDAVSSWQKQSDCYELVAKRSVYDILLAIAKEEQRNYTPSSFEKIIAPAVEKIKATFTDSELSVPALAAECGISEVYLRRLFSAVLGVSPKEYILSLRIDRAKQLLLSGQFSVSDTAFLCGYTDACHFSREFKKRTGSSPSEYL